MLEKAYRFLFPGKSPAKLPGHPGVFDWDTFTVWLDWVSCRPGLTRAVRARLWVGSVVLYGTGCRLNELVFFDRARLDRWLAGEVVPLELHTKTGWSPRDLLISADYAVWLSQQHDLEYYVSIVFPRPESSLLEVTPNRAIHLWNGYLAEFSTHLNRKTPHGVAVIFRTHSAFRHGYVQRLSAAGVPVEIIAKLVGHRSARTTERYNLRRLSPAELSKLVNKIK